MIGCLTESNNEKLTTTTTIFKLLTLSWSCFAILVTLLMSRGFLCQKPPLVKLV